MNTTTQTTFTFGDKEFRVVEQFDGRVFVVELPGQGRPSAWYVNSQADFIESAHRVAGSKNWDRGFSSYTPQQLLKCYGSEPFNSNHEDARQPLIDALALARRDGKVVNVDGEWVALADANEYEWAVELFDHDLYAMWIIESMDDAIERIDTASGHNSTGAVYALVRELESAGLIEEIDEDDEEA